MVRLEIIYKVLTVLTLRTLSLFWAFESMKRGLSHHLPRTHTQLYWWLFQGGLYVAYEPKHDKTYNTTCVTSNESYQPVHPPSIAKVLIYSLLDSSKAVERTCDQQRLWSDCADAQVDLSLRWSHKSCCRFRRALTHMLFSSFGILLFPVIIKLPPKNVALTSWRWIDVNATCINDMYLQGSSFTFIFSLL